MVGGAETVKPAPLFSSISIADSLRGVSTMTTSSLSESTVSADLKLRARPLVF